LILAKLTFKLNFSSIISLIKLIKPTKSLIKSLNLINSFNFSQLGFQPPLSFY
jgi:hypothetical protein